MPPVSYHLGKFPPKDLNHNIFNKIASEAIFLLGKYDGLLQAVPNGDILLSPLKLQEATLSSKIEGTRVTVAEVLEINAGIDHQVDQSKKDDAIEVNNYRNALTACAEELEYRQISIQMLRTAHSILLEGARGKDKSPGTIRSTQNWIGSRFSTIEEASFIPIAPELLQSGLDAWQDFILNENDIDIISKIAIMHVEFEALHPFLDGNGRIGRMLIPLILYSEGYLSSPSFYMSLYFEKHRIEYQQFLRNVSKNNEWSEWILFFANGVKEQCKNNIDKLNNIKDLYKQMKVDFREITRSQFDSLALDYIFNNIIFSSVEFCNESKIPEASAKNILSKLGKSGILQIAKKGAGRTPTIFKFNQLLDIIG